MSRSSVHFDDAIARIVDQRENRRSQHRRSQI